MAKNNTQKTNREILPLFIRGTCVEEARYLLGDKAYNCNPTLMYAWPVKEGFKASGLDGLKVPERSKYEYFKRMGIFTKEQLDIHKDQKLSKQLLTIPAYLSYEHAKHSAIRCASWDNLRRWAFYTKGISGEDVEFNLNCKERTKLAKEYNKLAKGGVVISFNEKILPFADIDVWFLGCDELHAAQLVEPSKWNKDMIHSIEPLTPNDYNQLENILDNETSNLMRPPLFKNIEELKKQC